MTCQHQQPERLFHAGCGRKCGRDHFSACRERRLSEQPGPYCAVSCLGARCASVFRFSARPKTVLPLHRRHRSLVGLSWALFPMKISSLISRNTHTGALDCSCMRDVYPAVYPVVHFSCYTQSQPSLSAVAKIDQELCRWM